jgi:hypothetical protein
MGLSMNAVLTDGQHLRSGLRREKRKMMHRHGSWLSFALVSRQSFMCWRCETRETLQRRAIPLVSCRWTLGRSTKRRTKLRSA